MTTGPFTFDLQGTKRGPFNANEIHRLVQEGVLQPAQLITTASEEEVRAGDVSVETTIQDKTPRPPSLPTRKSSWDPRVIGWLGLVFSPLWSGIMAAVNARRLSLDQPIWRPIVVALVALLVDVTLDLVGIGTYLVSVGLFVGAAWLIWRLDLRLQLDAHLLRSGAQVRNGRWLVPLVAGSPLAALVFVIFVVAPLIPKTPEYVTANAEGLALYEEGEFEDSLRQFDRSIELNPEFAYAYYNRGLAQFELGKAKSALGDFDIAIRLSPDLTEAYLYRGLLFNELGEFDKALNDFNKLLESAPDDVSALSGRGVAYLGKKELDQAIADFTNAVRIDPQFASAYENRAAAHLAKQEHDNVVDDCSKAISLDSASSDSFLYRGIAYCELGNSDKGLDDFTQAIRNDPTNPFAYNLRGIVRFSMKDYSRVSDFDEAIRLKPDFQEAKEFKDAAEQAAAQIAANQAATPSLSRDTSSTPWPQKDFFKPSRFPSDYSSPRDDTRIHPAIAFHSARGVYYALVHGGLGKKLLVVLAAIGAGIATFWKRLSAKH